MAIESGALFIGWNRPVRGREGLAGELFTTCVGYYDKLQKSGKLTGYETVFLTQHGGDMNGFFILKGTHANLAWLQTEEEFVDIQLRAGHVLDGFGVIPAFTGNQIPDMMTRWSKHIPR